MAKILIVDDEPRIRELLRENLQYAGYACEEAGDGSAALSLLSGGGYDLVILDLMMPFMDGMTCLREMRNRHINTPVIILTARGEEYDKLAGLEGGADDYVVKPFSPRELVARVKAVLNRTMPRSEASDGTMTFGELTIDTASHTVKVSGEEVSLTPKEFDLLVLADEIYTRYLYEGEFIPMRTLPGMAERTVTLNSFSKNFLMTGWRVGVVIAPAELISVFQFISNALTYTAPSISQRAAIRALALRHQIAEEYICKYRDRVFYASECIKINFMALLYINDE